MLSFPRIVLYNDPKRVSRSFHLQRCWTTVNRFDPIILVKQNENIEYTESKYNVNYFIPIKDLLLDKISLTAITRWPVRYRYLPYLYKHEFIEIDDDWIKSKDIPKIEENNKAITTATTGEITWRLTIYNG